MVLVVKQESEHGRNWWTGGDLYGIQSVNQCTGRIWMEEDGVWVWVRVGGWIFIA